MSAGQEARAPAALRALALLGVPAALLAGQQAASRAYGWLPGWLGLDGADAATRQVAGQAWAVLIFSLVLALVALLVGVALVRPRSAGRFFGLRAPARGFPTAAAVLATPFLAYVGFHLRGALFPQVSEQLRAFERLFELDAGAAAKLALIAATSLGPAVGEELLTRGLLLRAAATLMPAFLALALTTLVFAAMHLDPQHVVTVLPLSAWLGWLAWRSGSLLPAVLGHALNNLVAGGLFALGLARTDALPGWVHALCLALFLPLWLYALWRGRVRSSAG